MIFLLTLTKVRYAASVNEYQQSLRKIQAATVMLRVIQGAIVNTTLLFNLLITFRSLSQGQATVGGKWSRCVYLTGFRFCRSQRLYP